MLLETGAAHFTTLLPTPLTTPLPCHRSPVPRFTTTHPICYNIHTNTRFTNLTHDPLNTRFGRDWARLTRDLLFDAEGSLTWKPELWADIRKVIVPQIVDKVRWDWFWYILDIPVPFYIFLVDFSLTRLVFPGQVGYIPIPRAEFTDDKLDLVIENLTLSGRNLFPK